MSKLDHRDLHLLRLIARDQNAEGWTKVSMKVWPLVLALPDELCELRPEGDAGCIRLTLAGETVLAWT